MPENYNASSEAQNEINYNNQMPDMDYDDSEAFDADSETIHRHLAFISDGLTYAINVGYVIEIITNHAITILPMVPSYIAGIINLRGQIIPIIDIRLRMGKAPSLQSESNCIIVLNIDSMDIGIMVDNVSQVLDIDESKISPMPSSSHQELVSGILNLTEEETILFFNCDLLMENI